MKVWVLPLVLIIGWLSIIPCCDAAGHEEKVVDTCAYEPQTEGEECPTELPCSPFYNCGSCVGCIFTKGFLMAVQSDSQPVSIIFFELPFILPSDNLFLPLKPPRRLFHLA